MDFSSSFKKSFKNHGRRISIEDVEADPRHEEEPILSDRHRRPSAAAAADDRREVIVKIDSFDRNSKDLPPRLHIPAKPLDVDLEMNTSTNVNNPNDVIKDVKDSSERVSTSKELKVSFQAPSFNGRESINNDVIDIPAEEKQKYQYSSAKEIESSSDEEDIDDHSDPRRSSRMMDSNVNNDNDIGYNTGDPDAQVLRCSSFSRRTSVLGRLKTKSRLLDPSPERMPDNCRKSGIINNGKSGIINNGKSGIINNGKSGQMPRQSGIIGMVSGMLKQPQPPEEEEDDPLFDEDIPEELRKSKLNAVTLLQWFSLVLIITALACTLAIPEWKGKHLRGLRLWKWEVLILVLICGRLVSGWGIRIVVLLIERNFVLRKRVLYFVYGIRKAVQNCIWLGLVLVAWHYLFDKKVEGNNDFLRNVNKIMVCMLVATLLWLVKTLMVKVLASSFHVSAFFDRIQESLFNQYVIEVLSGPPVIEIKCIQDEEERTMAEIRKLQNAGATLPPDLRSPVFNNYANKSGVMSGGAGGLPPRQSKAMSMKISGPVTSKSQEDPGISIDHLHRLNPQNISAWNMKRLMNIVRQGVLSTLDEQIMGTSAHDESSGLISSEFEAKVAARKIFRNVAKPRAKFIHLNDLMRFLREDEALKTMAIVEGSEFEKISKGSLKNWVVNAFRERRALALTLNDTKTAVNKLRRIVNVLVALIILIICLLILGLATTKTMVFVSSQVVVAAFVFGNTCKTVFEAIIFVFVIHPFDVGDRCEIDGVQMIVEEMNILTTVFLRYDNQKIVYPNSTLSTKAIHNYYRSPDMGDSIDFTVHIATPPEKIAIMNQRIISCIESKKDHWYSSPAVVLMNLEDLNRLKMSVWMRHKMNHQDMGTRWQRRAILIEEMVKIFKELDIEYRLYPIDINIRSVPPVTSSRMPSNWPPSAD